MGAKATRDLVGAEVFDDYFTFAIERNPWDAVVSLYYWKYKDRAELPDFEAYVQEIWIEQLANNRRLYRIRGKMALDRVLRYENLDGELREVWEHLGLPGEPDLPRAKGNARPAGHYRELYTPESKERVADGVRRHDRRVRLRVLMAPTRPAWLTATVAVWIATALLFALAFPVARGARLGPRPRQADVRRPRRDAVAAEPGRDR